MASNPFFLIINFQVMLIPIIVLKSSGTALTLVRFESPERTLAPNHITSRQETSSFALFSPLTIFISLLTVS